jgi:tetratricopeptide (TPR) repeat protein
MKTLFNLFLTAAPFVLCTCGHSELPEPQLPKALGTAKEQFGTIMADTWETVLDGATFNSYSAFEAAWNYLYPWGSDHNGSARMYGSATDHNHIYLVGSRMTLLPFARTCPMSRLRRTALLVACCTPAGLFVGCNQSPPPPSFAPAPTARPLMKTVPSLSEPRLLTVPTDVRPVAGDWVEGSDAALRHSDRHQQGTAVEPYQPQRIAAPAAAAPISEPPPSVNVVRPITSLPHESLPAQAGPYSVEQVQPFANPSAPIASSAPQMFAAPSIAPHQATNPPAFQPPQFVASATPAPVLGPARDRSGFQAVSERIVALNYQAIRLANRGAVYAAKEDLLHALRIASQSLDAADGTSAYSQALNQGLTALREAEDFALHGAAATQPLEIDQIIAGHRTPVLREQAGYELSPVVAMQQYYGYAGQRLTFAAGELPAAADSLFWLGKVYNSLARQSVQADRLQGPQAMVCFRAALAAAPQHYLAANELGVLFARYGELNEAKKLLQQSVTVKPHAEGWQNLAIVHERLGETQLAQLAKQEFTLAASRSPTAGKNQPPVTWLDTKQFAATAGPQPTWEQPAKSSAVAAQPNQNSSRR